ncbi:hypothetical protein XENTR_v10017901 [Xenopus tropicalis]|nr:hypothetical protein XENTR_v10017901 [Xenopus tropicalis]
MQPGSDWIIGAQPGQQPKGPPPDVLPHPLPSFYLLGSTLRQGSGGTQAGEQGSSPVRGVGELGGPRQGSGGARRAQAG